ncbi:S24 family peptidase [Massilia timonae]|uniref:S24 family peptidase n=1 Tax=Massilia timonae TaxID=47229 RepID=UPI0028D178FA|nr:S24 family peptidase [Massilia timonae]
MTWAQLQAALTDQIDSISVRAVKLRLRAGISGFEVEPEMFGAKHVQMTGSAARELGVDGSRLLALQVAERGLEPLVFEDDWVVVDTADTVKRNREVYAVNWDGEAVIAQLLQRGGQWYLSFLHPDFEPINVRSGQMNVVGRVVYQPGRLLTGRL